MNKFTQYAIAIAISAVACHSNAASPYTYGASAGDICRHHVTEDAAGKPLRYRGDALIAPAEVRGRTLVYLNAKVNVDGKLQARRVHCEVSNLHGKVLAASVASGRFVQSATS